MNRRAPIVAELGRPETPQETADRKAAASAAYRSSQTVRHLIAALILTVAVVLVIVWAVPRGERVPPPAIDIPAVAANVESSMQRPVLVPDVPADWYINAAELQGGAVPVWKISLAPADAGFVNIAQAFDADVTWAPQMLGGIAPSDAVTIDGRSWDVFTIKNAADNANISYALGTQAGADYLLLYGSLSEDATAELAEALSPHITDLEEAE